MSDQEREALWAAKVACEKDHRGLCGCCFDIGWEAGVAYERAAAREERSPDGKIQMYNLDGEYPNLPTRLLEWPDFCEKQDQTVERLRRGLEEINNHFDDQEFPYDVKNCEEAIVNYAGAVLNGYDRTLSEYAETHR